MLQTVKKKFAKLSNYPRLRVFLIIVVIIGIFVLIMNLLTPSASSQSAAPSHVQTVTSTRGTQRTAPENQSAQYKNLTSKDQALSEQQAIQSGGSVFETGKTQTTSVSDEESPSQFAAMKKESKDEAEKDALAKQISDLQKQLNSQAQQQNQRSAESVTAQQRAMQESQQQQRMRAQVQGLENSMRSGVQNLSADWKLPTLATVKGEGSSSGGATGGGSAGQGPVAIKAGSILFGVIDTALSSDSPGTPVLATIVTGPYKGARLLGGFTATKDALVIQFNLMTLANSPNSISINAYAIDAKTANNAVATNVDNHYLLRYGMLFASAFLQGFGNAYQNYTYCPPGTQNCSVINTNGSSNLPSNDVTTTQAAYQGLGQIGTTLGQAAAAQFNTPPTITVDQGTGIGLLFMTDVRLPL